MDYNQLGINVEKGFDGGDGGVGKGALAALRYFLVIPKKKVWSFTKDKKKRRHKQWKTTSLNHKGA